MALTKANKFIHFKDLILYEDEHILLINKPVGMASLDDKSTRNVNHLARLYHPELKLCHRLDKMTSGVLLLAKGGEHYRSISLQFQHRQVRKCYHTLVAGVHQFDGYEINLPLLVTSNKKVYVNKQEGKASKTRVFSREQFRNYTLLQCEPVSGRMHQIRVHLAAIRCPIVGDQLYGGADIYLSKLKRNYKFSMRKEEQPLNHGYLLHAHSLEFTHPASGEQLSFTAPYPKNFEVVLKVLRKYNAPAT
ncbi:MAG: RluA family pseudouridine synthase [Bacteroidetes bacterium]|nr:MAG: RluA family pseudouridine synthase [Bacteroidota bacterium]